MKNASKQSLKFMIQVQKKIVQNKKNLAQKRLKNVLNNFFGSDQFLWGGPVRRRGQNSQKT